MSRSQRRSSRPPKWSHLCEEKILRGIAVGRVLHQYFRVCVKNDVSRCFGGLERFFARHGRHYLVVVMEPVIVVFDVTGVMAVIDAATDVGNYANRLVRFGPFGVVPAKRVSLEAEFLCENISKN